MHLHGCTHAASLSSASVAKQTQQDFVLSSSAGCNAWELATLDAGAPDTGFSLDIVNCVFNNEIKIHSKNRRTYYYNSQRQLACQYPWRYKNKTIFFSANVRITFIFLFNSCFCLARFLEISFVLTRLGKLYFDYVFKMNGQKRELKRSVLPKLTS